MMQLSKAHVFAVSLQLARNRHAANKCATRKTKLDICRCLQLVATILRKNCKNIKMFVYIYVV
jgi:hypothetical protein